LKGTNVCAGRAVNTDVENETIAISRVTEKLKLPDAIIAAAAIVHEASVVTRGPHFRTCKHPDLRLWA
jgi:predicted nucleic acid-binding protein